MTSTLRYPFTQSRYVIEELRDAQRPQLRQIPLRPHATSDIPAFEYIDQSLALVSNVLKTEDETLSHEFEQQRRFISDQFRSAFSDQALRDINLEEKIINVDQAMSKGFQELHEHQARHEEQLNALTRQVKMQEARDIRERNAHKFRLHHSVEAVPQITEEGDQQLPDDATFPRTVKHFWQLRQRDQRTKLCALLMFYGVQRLRLPRETDFDPNSEDEQHSDEEELSVVDGIIRDQSACWEELALQLGLNFERIQEEAEQMERFKQQSELPPERRRHDDDSGDDAKLGAKKLRQVSASSKASAPTTFLRSGHLSSSPSHISDSLKLSPTQRISSQE